MRIISAHCRIFQATLPIIKLGDKTLKQENYTFRGVTVLAGALTSLAAAAQSNVGSNVTLYGIADAGVEVSNAGKGTLARVISGGLMGSRWGLRGSEDLGGGLKAVFRLEGGFNIDDGNLGQGGRLFGREASVGLSSATLGTISLGRNPTPYYLSTVVLDAFGYAQVGGLSAITRSGTTTQQVLPMLINARNDNSVNYLSPNWGGLEFRAQIAAGEGSTSIGRAYGASARYANGPVDFILSYGRQNGAGNANGEVRSYSVGGSYDFGVVKAFAGYIDEKNSCATCTGALARAAGVTGANASEFRLVNVGVRVPISAPLVAIAQAVRISDRSVYAVNPGDRDATWVAVGAEYALSKRTILYGSAGTVSNSNGSVYALGAGAAQQAAGAVGTGDPRAKTVAIGVRHLF
jgi:predicted porin